MFGRTKVEEPLRTDLVEKAGPHVTKMLKGSMREADQALLPQETVVAVAPTRAASVLVLTDKRLINAYKAAIVEKAVETFRLTDIRSVEWSGQTHAAGKMTVNLGSSKAVFSGVPRDFSRTVEAATL